MNVGSWKYQYNNSSTSEPSPCVNPRCSHDMYTFYLSLNSNILKNVTDVKLIRKYIR